MTFTHKHLETTNRIAAFRKTNPQEEGTRFRCECGFKYKNPVRLLQVPYHFCSPAATKPKAMELW